MKQIKLLLILIFLIILDRVNPASITMRKNSIRRRSITINKAQTGSYKTQSSNKDDLQNTGKHYRYYLGPGNNSHLIRRVLSTRKNWIQITDSQFMFLNFKWQQTTKGFRYDSCVDNKVFIHSLNHMQFHQELSNKEKLLKNLMDFCEANHFNVYDYVPVTFVLGMSDPNMQSIQNQFMKFYQTNLPQTSIANKKQDKKRWLNLPRRRTSTNGYDRRANYHYNNPYLKNTYLSRDSPYLWILKPTYCNQGRGIHIFSTITELEDLIKSYTTDSLALTMTKSAIVNPVQNITQEKEGKRKTFQKFRIRDQSNSSNKVTTNSFIIQKYLQSPLLIDSRKFDIRVWVLLTHQMRVYFYRQGYIRTSSEIYDVGADKIDDFSVHLTNNSIQKHLNNYGKYQQGNQLSFRFFESYITKKGGDFEKVVTAMKKIVKYSMLSVKKKINKNSRKFSFQIFGYDFMVDSDFNTWLIQVNTNPSLEESSLLLENLLPRMIDDTFKITIDQIFNGSSQGNRSNYVLQNYDNKDNLWDFIIDLKKPVYGL